MKEKGINKLINLLNESEDGFVSRFISYDSINRVFRLDNGQSFHYTLILSKEYGFIQWLVENDKIGRNKNSDRIAILDLMRVEIKEQTDAFEGVEKYEWYIMVLSIQDNPIEFLIGILK